MKVGGGGGRGGGGVSVAIDGVYTSVTLIFMYATFKDLQNLLIRNVNHGNQKVLRSFIFS